MKSVMISIKPYWVFLIIAKTMGWNIDKEKTVEVRKTYPQDDEWDKVGKIYCTKDKKSFSHIPKKYQPFMEKFLGKVIGEFMCDNIYPIRYERDGFYVADFIDCKTSCLKPRDFIVYGKGKPLYGWSISGLIIYDKPKELSDFTRLRETKFGYEPVKIERPPQSWCYVEGTVYCKDCKHLMFSDCYAECGKAYKGIVSIDDFCDKGELR